MDVLVLDVASRPTAVVCRTTTWPEFPDLWRTLLDQVYAFLRVSDVQQVGHNVMLYLDDVPHVEIGVEVDRVFAPSADVVPSALPHGRVVMTVHRGGYEGLGAAHRGVLDWCAAQGLTPAGPRWEIYGDWQADPARLETEVYYLLA